MTSKEVRQKYLDFFKERGHAVIPSAPLIPENDPTTLFTSSGMQPMLPYLLGEAHPKGTRIVDSQRSFRAEDIEEVGDNRHTTFFEMLGNWSLGDYGRKEQIEWMFEFLIDVLGIDPERLYISVFIGDPTIGVPKDEAAVRIWQNLFANKGLEAKFVDIGSDMDGYAKGMGDARIFSYEAKKNWWSRAGVPEKMPVGEPGGPDSEMFYDFRTPHDPRWGMECHVNCDCGRFMEIGNNVFMEYRKVQPSAKVEPYFEKLAKPNVDFGGGLERITAASIDSPDVFKTDLFNGVITELEKRSSKPYAGNEKAMRIIADHLRGATQMIGDDIFPTNSEQGYVLRRLIRRAVRYSDVLGLPAKSLAEIAPCALVPFEGVYDYVLKKKELILSSIRDEEEKFRATIARGMKHFKELSGSSVSGHDAFILFTTYGFPVEMTEEIAGERGMTLDRVGYESAMRGHQELSRAGAEHKFKGGLADHSEKTVQYHTATHMLHEALRRVLGPHVEQRGSNITGERLRFDFVHPSKLTPDEIMKVERLMNEEIAKSHPMSFQLMTVPAAKAYGAIGIFTDKYDEEVKVYTLGDEKTGIFSKEICGGPHVQNTGEIKGTFMILKEEAVSAGIRRIKAVLR